MNSIWACLVIWKGNCIGTHISSKPRNLYSVFGVQIICHSFKMINLLFPLSLYPYHGARKDMLKPNNFLKFNILGWHWNNLTLIRWNISRRAVHMYIFKFLILFLLLSPLPEFSNLLLFPPLFIDSVFINKQRGERVSTLFPGQSQNGERDEFPQEDVARVFVIFYNKFSGWKRWRD